MERASILKIRFYVFAALVLGFAVPVIVAGVLARDWAKETMTLAFMEKAYLLERQVKANIELAVALGIPMRKRRVIDTTYDYFSRLLKDHHEVRFIAVADEALNLIVYDGTNKHRLRKVLDDEEVRDAMAQFRLGRDSNQLAQAGNFSVAVSPLRIGPGASGWLLVAADGRRTDGYLAVGLPSLVAAAVLVILVFWQVASFALDFFFFDRLGQLRRVFDDTREDRVCALEAVRRYDEPGYLAQLHNTVVHHLQDRYQQLSVYASEVRHAIYDKAVADRVQVLADEAGERLGHLESPSRLNPGLRAETQLRLPLFFLGLAAAFLSLTALTPAAPPPAVAQVSPWGWGFPISAPQQGVSIVLLWCLVPLAGRAVAGFLPPRSARGLLHLASASLLAGVVIVESGAFGAAGRLVAPGCVLAALILSAMAAVAAFRAAGRQARAPLPWLTLIFGSAAAAAGLLELGLGDLLGTQARLVVVGLLTVLASLLTPLVGKAPAPAEAA